eukprot:m51a1_g7939 hypothetical protein (372) ;mRNA; f:89401-105309
MAQGVAPVELVRAMRRDMAALREAILRDPPRASEAGLAGELSGLPGLPRGLRGLIPTLNVHWFYVSSVQVQEEQFCGIKCDDMALSVIKVCCRNRAGSQVLVDISHTKMSWGKWSKWYDCQASAHWHAEDHFFTYLKWSLDIMRDMAQSMSKESITEAGVKQVQGGKKQKKMQKSMLDNKKIKVTSELNIAAIKSKEVEVGNEGQWGDWGLLSSCPEGRFARGFVTKSEAAQGKGDDTALNGVRLVCEGGNTQDGPMSEEGPWGTWDEPILCPAGSRVIAFQVQEEKACGSKCDDTALNAIKMRCRNTQGSDVLVDVEQESHTKTSWGDWSKWYDCPAGTAVTGIRTRVEIPQGKGDDTALNAIHLLCSAI